MVPGVTEAALALVPKPEKPQVLLPQTSQQPQGPKPLRA